MRININLFGLICVILMIAVFISKDQSFIPLGIALLALQGMLTYED